MSQATTPTTDTDTDSKLTPLAHQIKNVDTDRETRDCPHNCHGTLTLTPAENVICESCRCTPDGVFLPPKFQGESATPSSERDPWGLRAEEGVAEYQVRYDNSEKLRMPGGQEIVYDEENYRRPNSVDDSYTWNLTDF